MIWRLKPGITPEMLGLIPHFLLEDDPRPAAEQFAERYVGGWRPMPGFTMNEDGSLKYPGDPSLYVLAECFFRTEIIRFYDHAWVSITQPDATFEVCRMD
jgi:hypothetical protein